MIRIGQDTYVKGPPAVYKQLGITKTIPAGTWVKLPVRSQAGAVLDLASETARIVSTGRRRQQGQHDHGRRRDGAQLKHRRQTLQRHPLRQDNRPALPHQVRKARP